MRMLTTDVPLAVAAWAATDRRLVHDRTRLHGAESAVLALLLAPLLARRIWPVPVLG